MSKKRALLVILDGWGIGLNPEVDAIKKANTPYYDQISKKYPTATLTTFGEKVGLPEGQMGNSEVGHLNIGAGRIVYQELARINNEIRTGKLADQKVLKELIHYAENNGKPLHLMGLVSDGGVHSHVDHLLALLEILSKTKIKQVYIHAFTDGRDTDPKGGKDYLKKVLAQIENTNATLSTIIGRYYAMDRDQRWERIQKAYDLLVKGEGEAVSDPLKSMERVYEEGVTDEFMTPLMCDKEGTIKTDDALLFFNFRTDRPRQITRALTQENFADFGMKKLSLKMATMVKYDESFRGIDVIYEKDNLQETLGEVIADNGLTQIRIAETEKYPHVTFFFNGGREEPFDGEERIMISSPKVATYDLAPEMSAIQVTEAICKAISDKHPDFVCLNYANADMVGHTGDFEAAQMACTVVDSCLAKLTKHALDQDYEIVVIADHGNSDIMKNPDGSPHTAHTTNLVPVVFLSGNSDGVQLEDGILADVAPTILDIMKIHKPASMTGQSLIKR